MTKLNISIMNFLMLPFPLYHTEMSLMRNVVVSIILFEANQSANFFKKFFASSFSMIEPLMEVGIDNFMILRLIWLDRFHFSNSVF